MNLWRPNRLQWVIIWCTFLTASHVWLNLNLADFVWNDSARASGPWGYIARVFDYEHSKYRGHVALVIIGMGLLLLWQFSDGDFRLILGRLKMWLLARKALFIGILVVLVLALVVFIDWRFRSVQHPKTVEFDPEDVRPVPKWRVSPEEFLKQNPERNPDVVPPENLMPNVAPLPVQAERPKHSTSELSDWKPQSEAVRKQWEEDRSRAAKSLNAK